MNQHFNRKTIEAAVRTAFANKDRQIAINGERSKFRYKVSYDGTFGTVSLFADSKENGVTYQRHLTNVVADRIIKSQRNKDQLVSLITNHFIEKIGEFKSELKAA